MLRGARLGSKSKSSSFSEICVDESCETVGRLDGAGELSPSHF